MRSFEHRLPEDSATGDLLKLLRTLNDDVDGILVQLPLPGHIDESAVIAAMDPCKDVDGFHVVNVGRLALGEDGFVPCTPLGCLMLLQQTLATSVHRASQPPGAGPGSNAHPPLTQCQTIQYAM